MALFLAIDLPQTIKKSLQEQIVVLKKQYPDFSWIQEENYKLILGVFNHDILFTKSLSTYLKEVTFDSPEFELYSGESDILIQSKITLSLQFRRQKYLERLVAKIQEKNLFTQSKKFIPSIVFARYRIPSKQQYLLIKKKIQALQINIEFKVKSISLFDNQIVSKTQTSKKLATFPLESFH